MNKLNSESSLAELRRSMRVKRRINRILKKRIQKRLKKTANLKTLKSSSSIFVSKDKVKIMKKPWLSLKKDLPGQNRKDTMSEVTRSTVCSTEGQSMGELCVFAFQQLQINSSQAKCFQVSPSD